MTDAVEAEREPSPARSASATPSHKGMWWDAHRHLGPLRAGDSSRSGGCVEDAPRFAARMKLNLEKPEGQERLSVRLLSVASRPGAEI